MRSKLTGLLLGTLLLMAAALGLLWLRQEPSIRPEDVKVQAILHPPGHGQNLLPYGHEVWTLEIILDRATERPLWSDHWSFVITPVVGGLTTPFWDHLKGLSDGTGSPPAGGEGYLVVRDARVRAQLASLFLQDGVSYSAQQWDQVYGFRYAGERFPTRMRYYLDGGNPDKPEEVAVAYSHMERRWGRDLGWSRLVRARVGQGTTANERE